MSYRCPLTTMSSRYLITSLTLMPFWCVMFSFWCPYHVFDFFDLFFYCNVVIVHVCICIVLHTQTKTYKSLTPKTFPWRCMYSDSHSLFWFSVSSELFHIVLTWHFWHTILTLTCTQTCSSLTLAFSLSLHRHPSICILFNSHFTSYNKHKVIVVVF
jgi:hypothetical protein